MEFLLKDCIFAQLHVIAENISFEVICDFIENYIYKHPNKRLLLANISNFYMLIAAKHSENFLKVGEKTWHDILSQEQCDFLDNHQHYILGYIWISNSLSKVYHYIEFIDTRLRGYNLAAHMISKYEKYNEVALIPKEIIHTSAEYWKKYFDSTSKKEIKEYLEEMHIDPNDINWDYLYDILE